MSRVALFAGLIGSLFSLLQFIASPVIGAASDVYGRKPLLVLTMVSNYSQNTALKINNNKKATCIAKYILKNYWFSPYKM